VNLSKIATMCIGFPHTFVVSIYVPLDVSVTPHELS
jgi:hypothetical protein